jgi:hypothetical protein
MLDLWVRALQRVWLRLAAHPSLYLCRGGRCSDRCIVVPPRPEEGRIPATSLKSFHALGKGNVTEASSIMSCPTEKAKLTRREASHFIITMAARNQI